MKKILYFSPVDWDWIKQRPQFLAEALSSVYDINVIYKKQFNRKGLQKNIPPKRITLRGYHATPTMCMRGSTLVALNTMIECRNVQKALDEVRPDIVWLTHPTQLKYLGEYTVAKIVYDCMDDYLLLGCDQKNRTEIAGMEQALCKAASFIFASSDELVTRLKERYDISGKLSLVRNGCEESLIPNVEMQPISRGDCFRLMYFGTISDWFDFEVIEESLERFPEIEYILAGPIQVANPPMNERIHYIGTVPHKKLANFAKEADCLVMPFLRTELVDAVDPVKMYEYISFQKNILCTEYPEARRFNEFAILYSDNEEYMEKLAMLIDDNHLRYKWTDAKAFLEVNTWQKRAEQISRIIG